MNALTTKFIGTPLAISENGLQDLFARLESTATITSATRNGSTLEIRNGLAIIHVSGVLAYQPSAFERQLGFYPLEQLVSELNTANASDAKAIVLRFDSPGGAVTQIPEVAALIAANPKPVYAYTDTQMSSAAFWLASGCAGIGCAPSAVVGSVGIVVAVRDVTAALDHAGMRVESFTSGSLKGAGLPGLSLTDPQRAHLQAAVSLVFSKFVGHIEQHRGTLPDEVKQGGEYHGWKAQELGLVDSLHNSFAHFLASIGSKRTGSKKEPVAAYHSEPALRAEFPTVESFTAYAKAVQLGRVRDSEFSARFAAPTKTTTANTTSTSAAPKVLSVDEADALAEQYLASGRGRIYQR